MGACLPPARRRTSCSPGTPRSKRSKIFPSAQLGGETESAKNVQLGTLEATIVSTSNLSSFLERLNVLSVPYIFKSIACSFSVVDGPVGVAGPRQGLQHQALQGKALLARGSGVHVIDPERPRGNAGGNQRQCDEHPARVPLFRSVSVWRPGRRAGRAPAGLAPAVARLPAAAMHPAGRQRHPTPLEDMFPHGRRVH